MPRRSIISAALTFAIALGGCAGGSGVPGLPGGGQGSDPPPIPLQVPADRAIEDRIAGILSQVDGLGGIRVRVTNGVVRLSGETESLDLEKRAGVLAGRVEGVVTVDNEIVQTSRLSARLALFGQALTRIGKRALDFIPHMFAALVVFAPFLLLSVALHWWRRPLRIFGVSRLTGHLVRMVVRIVLVIVGALVSLQVLGIMGLVGAVVGTLGILGLIASFAFKDWIANYLPGVMLGVHPPFEAGNLVRIGAHEGRVIRITPGATVLMTLAGEEVRIPNELMMHDVLINYSRHRLRRLCFPMLMSPAADLRETRDRGREALLAVHGIVDDPPPLMRVSTFERDATGVEFLAWVDQDEADFRHAESRAKRAVLESLTSGQVPLAEPSLVVRLPGRPSEEAVARPAAPAPEDDSEERDEAYLARRLEEARGHSDERDLLEEARRKK